MDAWTKVCPIILITLSVVVAVMYGLAGDWRRTIYWVAAAVLMASVTF